MAKKKFKSWNNKLILNMEDGKFYSLPKLAYGLEELEPYISKEQLALHYEKHHQAYARAANNVLEKLEKARQEKAGFDIKALLKELCFNVGGYLLHTLFWENLAPKSKGGGKEPNGALLSAILEEFGSFDRFGEEFSGAALSVEGSGWAGLVVCPETSRLLIAQIEKHNVNVFPNSRILMVIDVWEHAYYLDYKNNRQEFINAFWNIVSWQAVSKRFEELK